MALPTTKTEFKNYILRKLGQGAIDINVTIDQVNDRVDEALEHFAEYHDEGTEHIFLEHPLTQPEIDQKFIQMPPEIIGVSGYLNHKTSISTFYDIEYQYMQENIHDIANAEMRYFYIAQKHLSLIDSMFDFLSPIRFNKSVGKLYIDEDWNTFAAGEYLVFDTLRVTDPDSNDRIWSNKWLRDYTAALVKLQWGSNLSKYQGIALIGGNTFDGARLIQEANEEIQALEEQVKVTESVPLGIFIG